MERISCSNNLNPALQAALLESLARDVAAMAQDGGTGRAGCQPTLGGPDTIDLSPAMANLFSKLNAASDLAAHGSNGVDGCSSPADLAALRQAQPEQCQSQQPSPPVRRKRKKGGFLGKIKRGVSNAFKAVGKGIRSVTSAVGKGLKSVTGAVAKGFSRVGGLLKNTLGGVAKGIGGLLKNTLGRVASTLSSGLSSGLSKVFGLAGKLFGDIPGSLSKALSNVLGNVSGLVNGGINTAIHTLQSAISNATGIFGKLF